MKPAKDRQLLVVLLLILGIVLSIPVVGKIKDTLRCNSIEDSELFPTAAVAPQLNAVKISFTGPHAETHMYLRYSPEDVLYVGRDSSNAVQYESCYSEAPSLYPAGVRRGQGIVRGRRFKDRTGWSVERGRYRESDYEVSSSNHCRSVATRVFEALESQNHPFCRARTARAHVEQFVHGKWTKLTPTRWVGQRFVLAPADTIKLRARFALVDIDFYVDRAEIRAGSFADSDSFAVVVSNPRDGFWPPGRNRQQFFKEFQPELVLNETWFRWEYPAMPATRIYSFDITPVAANGRQSLVHPLVLSGPNMLFPERPEEISNWPLVPLFCDSGIEPVSDLGYPGGALVPLWAAQKLYSLGPGFLTKNVVNREAYRELSEEYVAKRDADRKKKRR